MKNNTSPMFAKALEDRKAFQEICEAFRPGIQRMADDLGVDRECATLAFVRNMEFALLHDSIEAAQDAHLRFLFTESQARTPWVIRLLVSALSKELPKSVEIYDSAVNKGQDPVTALSIAHDFSMGQAAERAKSVRRFKEGRTVEEVIELSLKDDEGLTYEEALARLA